MDEPDCLCDPTSEREPVSEAFAELDGSRKLQHIRQDPPAGGMTLLILSVYQGMALSIMTELEKRNDLLHSAWQFILKG